MPPRSRSASPPRAEPQPPSEPRPKKQKTSGFKWKAPRPRDDVDAGATETPPARGSDRLARGYRERSPRRERERERGSEEKPRREKREQRERGGPEGEEGGRTRDEVSVEGEGKGPGTAKSTTITGGRATDGPSTTTDSSTAPKAKKPKKTRPPPPPQEMILVHVNDRLGTKAAIPCLASDSIKAFKAVVAAHIGRQPHEIMVKRQGERPFKDALTLEDYGVSSGVQLDLEVDTGD